MTRAEKGTPELLRPWDVGVRRRVSGVEMVAIGDTTDWVVAYAFSEKDARAIVEAVNSYDDLLATNAAMVKAAEAALTAFRYMRDVDTMHWDYHVTPEVCTAWDKLREALARAGESK